MNGKSLTLLLTGLVLLMAASCASIKDVVDKPENFSGKTVIIQGVVADSIPVPFREEGVYRISQGDSSLWVFSKKVPEKGKSVTVMGEVKTGFRVVGRTFGVILVEN